MLCSRPPQAGHLKPSGHRDATITARHCSSLPYCRSNAGSLSPFWNCTALRAISIPPPKALVCSWFVPYPGRLSKVRNQVELWWQDEARVGQKNKIARRWARRGTRPRAPHDQRTSSVYIFGAICPQEGKGAALVMPRCDTQAMSLHLAEVAQAVAPGAHGVMLMDRAGWHRAKDLVVPDNLTLVLLPARAPELNPVENIWQFLRDNWLSSRVFGSYADIVDHGCGAWNRLIDQPWLIMSIGLRDWANA